MAAISFSDKQSDTLNYHTPRPIQGPQEGSEAIFWPYFGVLNNFPNFLMNNSIEYSGLY